MRMQSGNREIDKIYKRRDRYDIPDWQRQKRLWQTAQKQKLIDSILRGWKLPKFYFRKTPNGSGAYEVVDGQQRLLAIWDFIDGELVLSDESAREFGAQKYKELPDDVSDAFDDYKIEYDEIEADESEEKDVKEFFQRLQASLPLTSAEKLNSMHSELRDYLVKLAEDPFFTNIGVGNTRHAHFDILAKVAAIELDGLEVGLRFDDLKAMFDTQSRFSTKSNCAKRIRDALSFVNAGMTANLGGMLRNRTLVQSLLTLVCRLLDAGVTTSESDRVCAFFTRFLTELNRQVELGQKATDTDYLAFQRTVNANKKGSAAVRNRILVSRMIASDPELAQRLDSLAIRSCGVERVIAEHASEIVRLVGELNEQYSAQHGVELFKSTSRTTQALARLGKMIDGFDQYKAFIEALYFVFWEGPGTRLEGQGPQSFRDANDLRTGLQHDIDHGSAAKARAKKKHIADVFRKYAGASSPAGLAPERFVIVQSNLLNAIRQDLRLISV